MNEKLRITIEEGMGTMKLVHDTEFLTPTAKLKQLLLLQHIEVNPGTTQKEMARTISAAPSMVNYYLNEYEEKNYIKRDYVSAKIVKYKITTEGLKQKNYLLINYLHELLKLYKLAEENVVEFLNHLEDMGYRKVLFYGAGEVAETILGIVRTREDSSLKVIGIIDDDERKKRDKLLGFEVLSREKIGEYDHDAIVITSYSAEVEILKKLKEMSYPEDRIIQFFSA